MSIIDDMKFKLSDVSEAKLPEAANAAMTAMRSVESPARPSGCGRAYVFVGYGTLRKNSKAAKILSGVGFKMFPRPYCKGVQIYIGYDNCSGWELARAEAVAKAFRDAGIPAGADADGD